MAAQQKSQLSALGRRPARGERFVCSVLGRLERRIDDLRPRLGEHDEREPRIAQVRLPVDEPDPLEGPT